MISVLLLVLGTADPPLRSHPRWAPGASVDSFQFLKGCTPDTSRHLQAFSARAPSFWQTNWRCLLPSAGHQLQRACRSIQADDWKSASFETLSSPSQIVFRARTLYYSIKLYIRILSHAHQPHVAVFMKSCVLGNFCSHGWPRHLGSRKRHEWELLSSAVLKLGVVLWTWGLMLHTGSIFIHLQTFEIVIYLYTNTVSQHLSTN